MYNILLFPYFENYEIISCYVLLGFGLIGFLANLIGYIFMMIYYRQIKFENLIIFGSILESCILIAQIWKSFSFLVQFADAIQVTIITYIIRRLLRIIQYKYINSKKPIFQYVFVTLFALNLIIFLGLIISLIIKSELLANIFCQVYSIFVDIVCVIFFIVGYKIKKLISLERKAIPIYTDSMNHITQDNPMEEQNEIKSQPLINSDSDNLYKDTIPESPSYQERTNIENQDMTNESKLEKDVNYSNDKSNETIEDSDKSNYNQNNTIEKYPDFEIYKVDKNQLSDFEEINQTQICQIIARSRKLVFEDTRILQINLLIYSLIISSLYQTVYVIMIYNFISLEFEGEDIYITTPKTKRAFYLTIGFDGTLIILTFATFISFFWLLRNIYKRPRIPNKKNPNKTGLVLDRSINESEKMTETEKYITAPSKKNYKFNFKNESYSLSSQERFHNNLTQTFYNYGYEDSDSMKSSEKQLKNSGFSILA